MKGEKIAILGPTCSGKSSLLKALMYHNKENKDILIHNFKDEDAYYLP